MEKPIEFLRDMFPIDHQIIYETYISKQKDIDETISALINICNDGIKYPPTYEEAMLNPSSSSSSSLNSDNSSKRKDSRRNLRKKDWRPPICGKLSDDFLRVPNEIINNSASSGFVCKSCSKLILKPEKIDSGSSQLGSPHNTLSASEIGNIDTIIRKRMEDNVSQTRNVTMRGEHSLYSIQYLDDERLALMLQNQEFLQMIQSDPEFQQALKEDHKQAILDKEEDDEDIWQEREDSIRFRPQDDDLDYGYEQSDIVDPDSFLSDQQLPSNNDVSRMCKIMGKASRHRINSLAKRFFSIRRRKSSKIFENLSPVMDRSSRSNSYRWETESTQQLITDDLDSDNWANFNHNSSNMLLSSQRTDSNSTLI